MTFGKGDSTLTSLAKILCDCLLYRPNTPSRVPFVTSEIPYESEVGEENLVSSSTSINLIFPYRSESVIWVSEESVTVPIIPRFSTRLSCAVFEAISLATCCNSEVESVGVGLLAANALVKIVVVSSAAKIIKIYFFHNLKIFG